MSYKEGPREVPEVKTMPRSIANILEHADERDPAVFETLRSAVASHSDATSHADTPDLPDQRKSL